MRRRGWAAIAALLVLGGCGEGGDDEPTGTGVDTASPSASASTSGSATLPDPTPTVEPATGANLDVEGIQVRAPEKWRQTYDTAFVDTAQGRDGSLLLSVAATDQLSLRAAERYFWTTKKPPAGYEPQDTLVVGGLTANYYTAGDRFSDTHVVALWDSGYVVKVELRLDRQVAADRQRELVDSVVASYASPRTG